MTTTVLLIEDNEQNRYLATFLLEKHGFTVVSAADGVRGIELAQTCMPGIILLDIQLPKLDGYQIARSLRAHETLRPKRGVAQDAIEEGRTCRRAHIRGARRDLTLQVGQRLVIAERVELGDDAFEHAERLGDAALEGLQRFAGDTTVERGLAELTASGGSSLGLEQKPPFSGRSRKRRPKPWHVRQVAASIAG